MGEIMYGLPEETAEALGGDTRSLVHLSGVDAQKVAAHMEEGEGYQMIVQLAEMASETVVLPSATIKYRTGHLQEKEA